ncbi:MAG: major facilitator superfamily 1 [Acidimicrobiaceae bacterium]|nr:major facilitator superfamily 1 [Acidimicrobiaceae bacterium]
MIDAPRQRKRARLAPAVGVALGSFLVIGLYDGVIGTAWPSIRHALHLPIGELGLVQLASTAGFLSSSSVSGRLTAHLGRARTLIAATTLGTFALALFALSPNLALLLVASLGVGLAAGTVEPGVQSHVALTARTRTMNLLHGVYGVGATLGPVLITTLLVTHASWRDAYLLLLVLEASVGLGVLRRRAVFNTSTPSLRPSRRQLASLDTPVDAHPSETPLSRVALTVALGLFFVYTGLEVATGQWAFTLLTTARHLGTGTAGILVAGFWASLTAVRIGGAVLGDRVSQEVVLTSSAAGSVVGEALLWWNVDPVVAAVGLLLVGASLAPAFPLMMLRTERWAGTSRVSSAIGWQSAAATAGIAALSGIAGLLIDNFGLGTLCPYLFSLSIAFLALQLWALRTQDRRHGLAGASMELAPDSDRLP